MKQKKQRKKERTKNETTKLQWNTSYVDAWETEMKKKKSENQRNLVKDNAAEKMWSAFRNQKVSSVILGDTHSETESHYR